MKLFSFHNNLRQILCYTIYYGLATHTRRRVGRLRIQGISFEKTDTYLTDPEPHNQSTQARKTNPKAEITRVSAIKQRRVFIVQGSQPHRKDQAKVPKMAVVPWAKEQNADVRLCLINEPKLQRVVRKTGAGFDDFEIPLGSRVNP
jgi:hypothetical protein